MLLSFQSELLSRIPYHDELPNYENSMDNTLVEVYDYIYLLAVCINVELEEIIENK